MAFSERPQYTFSTGEVSPYLVAREVWDRYPAGCSYVLNLYGLPQGALTRRPGTRFIASAKDPDFDDLRLIPFVYNANQAYVLEFGSGYIRFYTDRGVIESSPGVPYEIVTPYLTGTDLFELNFVQLNDVMYLTVDSQRTRKLSRLGNANWTLEIVDFIDGPWLDENTDDEITFVTSGVTGTITISAQNSSLTPINVFDAAHVGTLWRFGTISGGLNHTEWATLGDTSATPVVIGDTCKNDGKVYEAKTGSINGRGDIAPIHDEGTVSDGRVDWEFLHDGWGYVEITAFTSASEVSGLVKQRIPGSVAGTPGVDKGTKFWQQGAWSDGPGIGANSGIATLGWPSVIGFFETRLWLAASVGQKQTIWASKTNLIENMSPDEGIELGVFDDNAFTRTLLSKKAELVRWMVTGDRFFIGTSEGVWTLRASDFDQPMTPENVQTRKIVKRQLANRPALEFDESLFFAVRGGEKMVEMTFDPFSEAVKITELTIIADHILRPGLRDLLFQERDNPQMWVMLNDGEVRTMTWAKGESVVGWFRQLIAGSGGSSHGDVVAMTTIPGSSATNDNEHDQIWVAVERTIDGANHISIEMVERRQEDLLSKNQYFLDAGMTLDGAVTEGTKLPTAGQGYPDVNLNHLIGETVRPWVDGAVHPDIVVDANGQFELATDVVEKVSVGLPTTWRWESLKPQILTSNRDPGLGKLKKVMEAVLSLYRTGQFLIGMKDGNTGVLGGLSSETQLTGLPETLQQAYRLANLQTMDAPRPLITGDYMITFEGTSRRNPIVVIEGSEPSNFTMIAATPVRISAERS